MIAMTWGRSTRRYLAWILVCSVVLIAAVATRTGQQTLGKPFGTDEADYVRAFSYGLASTFWGANERSGSEFALEVVNEFRTTGWARPFQRDWERLDAAGLRHYHPPLGLYPVAALTGAGVRDERTLRLIPVTLGVLACLCAALLASFMTEMRAQPIAALIAGLLVASSPYHMVASTELSFHAAFTLLSTLSLAFLVKTTRTGGTGWWCAASAAVGLTVLTVPYWIALLPPYLWVGWSVVRRETGVSRAATYGLGTIAATLLAAWPPFLVTAGFIKPVLMYGGIILKPLPGTATSTSWLVQLSTSHWLTIFCLASGLVWCVMARSRVPRQLIPVALYCAGFLLVTARVAHMKPLYGADLIAPLSALAAASVVALSPMLRLSVAGIALGLSVSAMVAANRLHEAPSWRSEMDAMSRSLKGARVLVTPRPAGAIVAYYAQDSHVVLDSGEATDVSALRAAANRNELDVVLQWGSSFEPGGVARELVARHPDASYMIGHTPVHLTRLTPGSDPGRR